MYLKWSRDNIKVSKMARSVSFGIPAYRSSDGFVTCPGAGACAGYCYARQGRYVMPNVKASREFNLAIAKDSPVRFAQYAIADLQAMRKVSIVRIHDSGDFFSQEYLDAWVYVASTLPRIRFYAYTKSLKLCFDRLPGNFSITQSMGGIWDSLIDSSRSHARVFPDIEALRTEGYINGTLSDRPALEGLTRIGLAYHGARSLTVAQKKYLERDLAMGLGKQGEEEKSP